MDARVAFGQKHQTRGKAKQMKTVGKKATAKVKRAAKSKTRTDETFLFAQVGGSAEQRVSFVVRVTFDARGRPLWTEVEHARSGKKEIFPSLDVQRLAAFVKVCILPARRRTATQEFTKRAVSLNILDVKIFSVHSPGMMTLTLDPDENFVVQCRFLLQGPDALSLTADGFSFQMKVYANEVTSGKSRLLTTHSANLVKDVLEYTHQADAPGLSPGLYRLITLVTLHTPIKMAAHHTRLIIHVAGIQAFENPAPSG